MPLMLPVMPRWSRKLPPSAAEREQAGRQECQWQRGQLPHEIRELVLDDQRVRNAVCWGVFEW